MKVVATKLGYYEDRLKKENEEFILKNESDFSSKWMRKLDSQKPTKVDKDEKNK